MRAIWPSMLPMTLQFIIVMIASAINDRLQRKLDYVEEERRILREQLDEATGGRKISFNANQRRHRLVRSPGPDGSVRDGSVGCIPL